MIAIKFTQYYNDYCVYYICIVMNGSSHKKQSEYSFISNTHSSFQHFNSFYSNLVIFNCMFEVSYFGFNLPNLNMII